MQFAMEALGVRRMDVTVGMWYQRQLMDVVDLVAPSPAPVGPVGMCALAPLVIMVPAGTH